MSITPTWYDLPVDFKKNVVQVLDYKSRCVLQKTSRRDRILVNSVPVPIDRVTIEVFRNSVVLHVHRTKIEYFQFKNQVTRTEYSEKPGDVPSSREFSGFAVRDLDLAIGDFLFLLANNGALIKNVCLQDAEGIDPERSQNLSCSLIRQMKGMSMEWKIRAESFYISIVTSGQEMLQIMSYLDPNTVEHIRVKYLQLSDEESIKLVEMDQWKKVKSLFIEEQNSIPVEKYSHVETFWRRIPKLEAADAWDILQNYVKKNPPYGAFFCVETVDRPLDVDRILENFNVSAINEPIPTPWKATHVLHTQKFALPSEGHVLVVLILSHTFTGRVCRLDSLLEDCYNFYTSYFSN